MPRRRAIIDTLATGLPAGLVPRAAPAPEIDTRPPEVMDPAHRAAVERGLAQVRQGMLATDAEVDAVFHLFG